MLAGEILLGLVLGAQAVCPSRRGCRMWHRPPLALFLLPALCIVLSQAQTGKNPPPQSPVGGADIYHRYCASCHGADGRGHGAASAKLKHSPPDLTQLKRANGGFFPAEYVREVIDGSLSKLAASQNRQMPRLGPVFHQLEWDQDLGEIRLDAITNYVASIQKK